MNNILLFKTDIKTKKSLKTVKPVFNNHPYIDNWYVDTEDIDNVLKIYALNNVTENEVIKLVNGIGFYCEVLED